MGLLAAQSKYFGTFAELSYMHALQWYLSLVILVLFLVLLSLFCDTQMKENILLLLLS